MHNEDMEMEFYALEQKYGREEAIQVASEEWGISVYVLMEKIKVWEDLLKWQ